MTNTPPLTPRSPAYRPQWQRSDGCGLIRVRLIRHNVGIDYLDFKFQFEKLHGAILTDGAIADLRQRAEESVSKWLKLKSWDIRVGQFYEVIRHHCVAHCPNCSPPKRRLTTPIHSKRTDPTLYCCPKCKNVLSPYPLAWEQFRAALAKVVGVEEAEIESAKWLVGDLGFS